MDEIYVGIDPGLSGAVAILENDKLLQCFKMPLYKKKNGKNAIDLNVLERHMPTYGKVYIEQQIPVTGQGISSTFLTGFNFGLLSGFFFGLGLIYEVMSSVKWKNLVLGKDRKEKYKDIDIKEISVMKAKQLFPQETFLPTKKCKKPDHNMAEACLIAYYGYLSTMLLGGKK